MKLKAEMAAQKEIDEEMRKTGIPIYQKECSGGMAPDGHRYEDMDGAVPQATELKEYVPEASATEESVTA